MPLKDRLAVVRKFRDQILQKKEALSQVLTQEMGKPITQSRNEVNGLLPRIDFFLEAVPRILQPEVVLNNVRELLEERISLEPLGVVANISAWNYPYFIGSNVFIPALLSGNAVMYKPSEYSTLSGMSIARLLHDSGLPEELFPVVCGGGGVGAELLKLPLNGVCFTGSYSTGKKISELMGGKMAMLQLELGGKDPVYVCDDVDIETVASSTADGAFYNTGQSCCAVERIYVHKSKYTAFIEAFLAVVKKFIVGDPMDEKTYIGPVTRSVHRSFLESQVEDAKRKGAKLILGGKRLSGTGYFFEPTVFVNVDHSMALMKEESFGPIIGIQSVQDDNEALKLMNDTEYGLTAGVYTKDKSRAERILSQVNTGTVYWNCCDRVSPRLPWSGRRNSGLGVTLSDQGILTFLQPKAWHLKGGV